MSRTWKSVWEARRLDPARGSVLSQLMAADGLDTGFGDVGEQHWRGFVLQTIGELGLQSGDSIFEVGCGAGAFLYEPYLRGVRVAGIDQSEALIGYARRAMPEGRFDVGDAAVVTLAEPCDAVVSCGVFLYFPSLEYARGVIARMASAARRAVAILDIPDVDRRPAAMAHRRAALGEAEYASRYAGLDHLYYDRSWVAAALADAGLTGVRVEDQRVAGYQNGDFRFNAFGWCSPRRRDRGIDHGDSASRRGLLPRG